MLEFLTPVVSETEENVSATQDQKSDKSQLYKRRISCRQCGTSHDGVCTVKHPLNTTFNHFLIHFPVYRVLV